MAKKILKIAIVKKLKSSMPMWNYRDLLKACPSSKLTMSANQPSRPDPNELKKVCDAVTKMLGFGERKSGPGGLKPYKKPENDDPTTTIEPVTQVDKTEEFEVKTFY